MLNKDDTRYDVASLEDAITLAEHLTLDDHLTGHAISG